MCHDLGFRFIAAAGDYYRVIVSWVESDLGFGGTRVLLVVTEGGALLNVTGTRLVVSGVVEGGRGSTSAAGEPAVAR